jgi:hypothetical protein
MRRAVLALFLLVAVFPLIASPRTGGSEPATAAGIKAVYELVFNSNTAELRARGEIGMHNSNAHAAAIHAKTLLDTAMGDLGHYDLSADNPTANLQTAANADEEAAHLLAAPHPDPLDEATAKAKLTEGLTSKAAALGLLAKLENSLAAAGSGQAPSATGSDQCQGSRADDELSRRARSGNAVAHPPAAERNIHRARRRQEPLHQQQPNPVQRNSTSLEHAELGGVHICG